MTDEQRAVQHWPAGWADANLPSLDRRRAHGLNFNLAFANACQCSPSRSPFLTSTYAPVNRATLIPATLNPALPNLATIFASAEYNVVYKGKWHLTSAPRLSHGGLRQKDYTACEEMIHIPMIFSNPVLFPKPLETNALAGLIDILPTLIAVAGVKPGSPLYL